VTARGPEIRPAPKFKQGGSFVLVLQPQKRSRPPHAQLTGDAEAVLPGPGHLPLPVLELLHLVISASSAARTFDLEGVGCPGAGAYREISTLPANCGDLQAAAPPSRQKDGKEDALLQPPLKAAACGGRTMRPCRNRTAKPIAASCCRRRLVPYMGL